MTTQCDLFCENSTDDQQHHVKVDYRTLSGYRSTAYVDHRTGLGTNKHSDEKVHLKLEDETWTQVRIPLSETLRGTAP